LIFGNQSITKKISELEDLELQFSEFQATSKEVESELEEEVQRNEKRVKELTAQINRIKMDHEEWMEKSKKNNEENVKLIRSLETQVEALNKAQEVWLKEKLRLERDNDDLERRERSANASVQDLTEKMSKLLEDNAWLQTEIEDQTSRSKETIQRMKDEIRDLRLEVSLSGITSKVPTFVVKETPAPDPSSLFSVSGNINNEPNSINLVDEMLQLVKTMEKKFAKTATTPLKIESLNITTTVNS